MLVKISNQILSEIGLEQKRDEFPQVLYESKISWPRLRLVNTEFDIIFEYAEKRNAMGEPIWTSNIDINDIDNVRRILEGLTALSTLLLFSAEMEDTDHDQD